jgi:iron complex transport system substrate-binding protein
LREIPVEMRIWTYKIVVVVLGATFFFLLISCSRRPSPTGGSTRTIKDMMGNQVTIPTPENIRRAAVIHTPIVQIAYVIGAQDRLCAVTSQAKRLPLISKFDSNLKSVSTPVSGWEVNIEELIASRPDVCIGSDKQLSKITQATSIPCLQIGVNKPGSYFEYQKEEVRFFGDIFGKKDRAEAYCRFLDQSLSLIAARIASVSSDRRPRVLIASERDHSGTYGKDSYMHEWLERSGCRNAAETLSSPGSANSFANISPEQILAWDPDILLISTGSLQELERKPAWSRLRAVKNKKVYRIPEGVFIWNRPTAEGSALFPLWMAATAYPELFADVHPESHIKSFWSDILKYNLSDEDVYAILHPGDYQ